MNRKFLRITLIGLIALAALASVWPALSAGLGIKLSVGDHSPVTGDNAGHPASHTGACTAARPGVTLVVDFGSTSKAKPLTFCAESKPATGWDVFKSAGVNVEGTSQYPVGFTCRIDGFPSLAQQDCQHTPTDQEGSWVYYTATVQGGSASGGSAQGSTTDWHFSMIGSSMVHPKCGDYQGWRFEKGGYGVADKFPRVKPEPFKCAN
jgi:hypothetical protein